MSDDDINKWASEHTKRHATRVLASLTQVEARDATEIAMSHLLKRANLDPGTLRTYPPELSIEKAKGGSAAPSRHIRVRFRDRVNHVGYSVSVHDGKALARGIEDDGRPPISDEELAEAQQALREHPELGRYVGSPGFDIQWFNPAHHDARLLGARIVLVENDAVAEILAIAVIDVDSETIVNGVGRG